uniref:Uncharacterized protein n=1 Tax=Ficedula albicollis TaxID=59894 RepID=A0A803VH53_FICAL
MAAFTPHASCSSPHFPLWLFLCNLLSIPCRTPLRKGELSCTFLT